MRRKVPMPAISPALAQNYLGRQFDNHDWMKGCPKEELQAHIRELGYRFATDPWHNQLVCFTLGVAFERFAYFLKMGGGKSKIVSDLLRFRKRRGELLRGLVLVPQLVHLASWEEQLRTHAPDLDVAYMEDGLGAAARDRILAAKSDVLVMTYAALRTYMTERVHDERKRKNIEQLSSRAAADFAARFNFVAPDEAHKVLSTRDSLYWQMAWYLSNAADYFYLLTGTPFGRDPLPLWAMMMLVDHGATLGTRMGDFRGVFYTPRKSYWAGVEWKFNEAMLPELTRVIKHRSISYEMEEVQDVPRKLYIKLPVRLRGDSLLYYQRILKGLQEAQGDYRSLDSVYTRMRQCASGFIAMRADDDSRIEVRFKDNTKLDVLLQLLQGKEGKFLVFHEFRPSGAIIEEALRGIKMPFAAMRGGTKDAAGEYHRFLNSKACKVFVLNNAVGSEAINPQYVCNKLAFYEAPNDPKQRAQAESRIWRPGQQYVSFIYDLTVQGTVEEKVQKYNRQGRDLLKAVMAGQETLAG